MIRKIAMMAMVDTAVKRAVMTIKNTVLLLMLALLSALLIAATGRRVSLERDEAS